MKINKIKMTLNNIGTILTFFLILTVVFALMLNLILNKIIISKYFSEIENREAVLKTKQYSNILQSKTDELYATVQDTAIWDDLYNKIQDNTLDETWFKENITSWIPDKFGVDLIIIANRDKKIIEQFGLDGNYDILKENKIQQSFDIDTYSEGAGFSGLIKYNGEIYIIGVCPVFKSNSGGISHGIVIMGRRISTKLIKKIDEEFGDDIFITYDDKIISNDGINKEVNENIITMNKNKNSSVYKFNDSKTVVNLKMNDISGKYIGNISVIQDDSIYLSTQKLIRKNGLMVMIFSVIIIMILGFKFKNVIIIPIKNLQKQIHKIKSDETLNYVSVSGPVEIKNLASSFNHMIDRIVAHKKENEELKISANMDYLTQAYNHKCYFESISKNISEGHKQIAILFCDIDNFKLVNDTYGHGIGDLVLKEIARIIKKEVREKDMVFRYGGEEFVVMMCDFNSEGSFSIAENIRKKIAKSNILQEYEIFFPITISIGIASYPKDGMEAEDLIRKADSAMYYSKQNGKNQSKIYNNDINVFSENGNINAKKELLMDSVLALAEAVDSKDEYTGKHSKMVSKYSNLLADKLGFTENQKNKLSIGALLHDCGKIGIPDNIINKAEKLSYDEYKIIKNHTMLGYNIIKHITDDEEIISCVRNHHERWDGKGYPDGLCGDLINIFSRIVCIADVYHAMTSDRSYRKALTNEEAIIQFKKGKGTQFDPKLVDLFIDIIRENNNSSF